MRCLFERYEGPNEEGCYRCRCRRLDCHRVTPWIEDCDKYRQKCRAKDPDKVEPPPLIKQGAKFILAATRHLLSGSPQSTQAEIDERHALCLRCKLYDPDEERCNHCGCHAETHLIYLNKLAWADMYCPVGRWCRRGELVGDIDREYELSPHALKERLESMASRDERHLVYFDVLKDYLPEA